MWAWFSGASAPAPAIRLQSGGRPRWRNKDGKVEKLVTMGSPSATAMHSTVWPYVEPEVTEYLYDRLMEQTERVIARAKARKG